MFIVEKQLFYSDVGNYYNYFYVYVLDLKKLFFLVKLVCGKFCEFWNFFLVYIVWRNFLCE